MAITRNDRAFGVSKYGIELQHTMAGFVKEVSGGDAVADVVAEKLGSDHLTKKHLGPLKYEEINFKCGTGMSAQLYEWIKTGFNQTSHSRGREDGAILFADMDNAEVSSGRASRQPNLLLTNGRRSFSGRTQGIPAFHRGLAWADFDRDGRVDLVVTRLNEPAQILWNRTSGPGNWLALELSGSPSNREAIGAWVEVETENGKQWDRVAGWSGYGCTSSRILHFGIGSAGEAQRIEVHWPSGRITRLSHIESGRTLQVKESESAETSSKP